jgi:hypothetical protein
MKKQDQQMLLYAGGIAVFYFGLLRPILTKLGIQQTAAQQQEEQNVTQTDVATNAANPFSPLFWKQGPRGTQLLTVGYATLLSDRIYNGMGYFYDDEAAIISVFRLLKTKSQVSWLADIFQKKYKTDLFDFLKKGKGIMYQAGLNNSELNQIISIVNKLPKYKL